MSSSEGAQYLNFNRLASQNSKQVQTIGAAQTQRWNTRLSETTSILGLWRNLKQVELNLFEDKECGVNRFGSKGFGKKLYHTQKTKIYFDIMVVIM